MCFVVQDSDALGENYNDHAAVDSAGRREEYEIDPAAVLTFTANNNLQKILMQ